MPEAFFARHKHDKRFAELGEQRRCTEMVVILMEVPWRVVLRSSYIEQNVMNSMIVQPSFILCLSLEIIVFRLNQ